MDKKLNINPEITINLINFNQSKYLKKAIDSVLKQSYRNFELIIIDNGSTDNSKSIIRSYLDDERIRFLDFDKNEYVTKRLNHSVSISKGKYINFLMADDFFEINKLKNQINIFKKLDNSYGVVYGSTIIVNEKLNKNFSSNVVKINGDALKIQLNKNLKYGHINFNSALIKKECLQKHPMLENIFIETESIFLCFALDYKFHFDNNVVCYFREHETNIGKKIFDNLTRHLKRIDLLKKLNIKEKKCKNKDIDNYRGNIIINIIWYNLRTNGNRMKNWRLIYEIGVKHKSLLLRLKFYLILVLNFLPKNLLKYLNFWIDKKKISKLNNIRLD
jgi:glycosyltransferase involved in cell wall biosynthesis